MRRLLIALLLLAAMPARALAPDEMPAIPDQEQPTVKTDIPDRPRPGQNTPVQAAGGTQVIGEQEAPIGLYIMPWRQSAAEGGLDRPARLLEDSLLPLDPDVFRRQVEYHRALSEHLEREGKITPQ